MVDLDTDNHPLPSPAPPFAADGTRAGAVAAAEGDLPPVVWLRGDEPHCADFSLDADAVMAELGIRRSRLTQISGRELRVGRIRRGRYVAPVYRPEDVQAYKSWTRAPATHAKSSAIINDAAESLRAQSEALEERLGHALAAVEAALDAAVRRGAAETARLLDAQVGGLRPELAARDQRTEHALAALRAQLAAQDARVAALTAVMEKQAAALAVLTKDLSELAALARIEREDRRAQAAVLAEKVDGLVMLPAQLNDVMEAVLASGEGKPSGSVAGARRIRRVAKAEAAAAKAPRAPRKPRRRKPR